MTLAERALALGAVVCVILGAGLAMQEPAEESVATPADVPSRLVPDPRDGTEKIPAARAEDDERDDEDDDKDDDEDRDGDPSPKGGKGSGKGRG